MKKRLCSILLAALMLLTLLPTVAFAEGGTKLGDTDTWYTLENGVLTIGGTGAMPVYNWNNKGPFSKDNDIISVVIEEGVTEISNYAFYQCENIKTVTFATGSKLNTIGESAFYKVGIERIEIPASVTVIGGEAFGSCAFLETVTFAADSKLETIGQGAFLFSAIKSIIIPAGVTGIGYNAFGDIFYLNTVRFLGKNVSDFDEDAFYVTEGRPIATLILPKDWPDTDKPDENENAT